MVSKCSCCGKPCNIVWSDYEYKSKTSIKLCYSCLKFLGYGVELAEIKPKLKRCNRCNKRFVSEKVNATWCGLCWAKQLGSDLTENKDAASSKEQKELVAYAQN